MITYEKIFVRGISMIAVYLDGNRVGTIHSLPDRHWYKPLGGVGGEKFKTLAEVKQSIEGK